MLQYAVNPAVIALGHPSQSAYTQLSDHGAPRVDQGISLLVEECPTIYANGSQL